MRELPSHEALRFATSRFLNIKGINNTPQLVARCSKCQPCLQTGQGICPAIDNMGQAADLEVCQWNASGFAGGEGICQAEQEETTQETKEIHQGLESSTNVRAEVWCQARRHQGVPAREAGWDTKMASLDGGPSKANMSTHWFSEDITGIGFHQRLESRCRQIPGHCDWRTKMTFLGGMSQGVYWRTGLFFWPQILINFYSVVARILPKTSLLKTSPAGARCGHGWIYYGQIACHPTAGPLLRETLRTLCASYPSFSYFEIGAVGTFWCSKRDIIVRWWVRSCLNSGGHGETLG